MAYIHQVQIGQNGDPYIIEPLLFATAGGTRTALTAGIANFTLVSGAYVHVKVGEVGSNATLNVNSTGAKDIYYNGIQISANMLTENNIYTFIYDGIHWNVLGDILEKNIIIKTTAEWQAMSSYIAPKGMILVYSDHGTYTSNNTTITVPGIKISDGLAYALDLPFVGDDVAANIRSELNDHINDNVKHITSAERTFWNNKLNCDLDGETLIINRL